MILKINRYTIALGFIVMTIGLVALAYPGVHNRYWADDYCLNTDFDHQGVIKAVGNYFGTGEEALRGYSPNGTYAMEKGPKRLQRPM